MNFRENKKTDKYGKLIKVLQILSFAFMLAMLVLCTPGTNDYEKEKESKKKKSAENNIIETEEK